jgi:hypothetical protein
MPPHASRWLEIGFDGVRQRDGLRLSEQDGEQGGAQTGVRDDPALTVVAASKLGQETTQARRLDIEGGSEGRAGDRLQDVGSRDRVRHDDDLGPQEIGDGIAARAGE